MSTVRHGGAMRVAALTSLAAMLAIIASHAHSADGAGTARRLTPLDARRAGVVVDLVRAEVAGHQLVQARLPQSDAEGGADAARRLLAIRSDGGTVAVADRIAADHATLTLAQADGSQLQVELPGLIAAGFAVDGTWLAVVDGRGALSRVDAATGERDAIADGPFLGPLTVTAAGDVILQRVASVEAPFRSTLVSVDPVDGMLEARSGEELVYGATLLDDGSLAIVAHRPEGTQVRRIGPDGQDELLADLGAGAVNAAVSPDASHVAWERHPDGVLVLDIGSGQITRIVGGSQARFSPDGTALLVMIGDRAQLVGLDGRRLADLDGPAAAFVPCAPSCRP